MYCAIGLKCCPILSRSPIEWQQSIDIKPLNILLENNYAACSRVFYQPTFSAANRDR
jgi:hypothetical protein